MEDLEIDVFWSFGSRVAEMLAIPFRGEPFFGQDRLDVLLWRLRQHGLSER